MLTEVCVGEAEFCLAVSYSFASLPDYSVSKLTDNECGTLIDSITYLSLSRIQFLPPSFHLSFSLFNFVFQINLLKNRTTFEAHKTQLVPIVIAVGIVGPVHTVDKALSYTGTDIDPAQQSEKGKKDLWGKKTDRSWCYIKAAN